MMEVPMTNSPHDAAGPSRVERDRSASSELGHQARAAAEDAKHEVGETTQKVAQQVKDQVRASATGQKDAAARQMDGFAHALEAASGDLRERGQDFAAQYVHQAAGGLSRASEAVRERDLDDLIGTVEDFARRQPVAFLGFGLAAGFGLARLMKSSADRRRTSVTGTGNGPGGAL
jgi:hypothetical protein